MDDMARRAAKHWVTLGQQGRPTPPGRPARLWERAEVQAGDRERPRPPTLPGRVLPCLQWLSGRTAREGAGGSAGFLGAPVSEGLSVLEKGLGVLEATASLSPRARTSQLGWAGRCCLPEGTPVCPSWKRVSSRDRAGCPWSGSSPACFCSKPTFSILSF